MKTFQQIREARKPDGKEVYSGFSKTKVRGKKISIKVMKDRKGYTAFVDGDRLDTFRSEKDAIKGAETIIKDLAR